MLPTGLAAETLVQYALVALGVCVAINVARPHFIQIIEASYFRTENVNNHIAGINQHPVSLFKALKQPCLCDPLPLGPSQHSPVSAAT